MPSLQTDQARSHTSRMTKSINTRLHIDVCTKGSIVFLVIQDISSENSKSFLFQDLLWHLLKAKQHSIPCMLVRQFRGSQSFFLTLSSMFGHVDPNTLAKIYLQSNWLSSHLSPETNDFLFSFSRSSFSCFCLLCPGIISAVIDQKRWQVCVRVCERERERARKTLSEPWKFFLCFLVWN